MSRPVKLSAVMTHPVQYYSPWFRYLTANCPKIELSVIYAIMPTPEQQGTGFGSTFEWDTALVDGYRMQVVREPKNNDSLSARRFFGLNVAEIASTVVGGAPDVTLIPGWYSATLVRAAFACRLKGIPVICRSDMQLGRITDSVRAAAWEVKTRTMLRFFTHFLSVGIRHTEYLEHFGISSDRIFFSPHCVDNDFFAGSAEPYHETRRRDEARRQFGIPPGDFVVLYVGKLENKKRPWDAVFASAALGPDVTLLIVGSGEAEPTCRDAVRESGANVVFSGFLNQSELGRAYALADCLVLPSDHAETWGLVVNEAMATGLPCVVSDAVGCGPDLIVAGRTGYTYPLGRVQALSTALASLRAQLRAGHSFSTDCRNYIAGYSFEKATEGLLSACNAAVTSKPGATGALPG